MPGKADAYMNQEVQAALRRIETVSKTLNQASDQLSQKIVEIETALNHYKLGIRAWLKKPLRSSLSVIPSNGLAGSGRSRRFAA